MRRMVWLVAPGRAVEEAGAGTPGDLGLHGDEVWLEGAGGVRLHAWFMPVAGPAPAVVVVHGWGGSAALMLPLAPHLHAAGFHALFLDVRNHGRSGRDRLVSMPRFADDLEEAMRWLRDHPAVTTVGVIGHSVGAGAAILSASRGHAPEALVSVSAPADPGELMRRQMAGLPRPVRETVLAVIERVIGRRFADFAPRNRIALVDAPTMLVHGALDRVVPVTDLHELAAARPGAEVLLVPDGAHRDLDRFGEHMDEIVAFLAGHLRR